jgi:aerobic carbon-monoxide dehydrogenase medium subunit
MINEFEYFAPKTLKEALKLMDKFGDDYKIICGGQSLLIMLRQGLIRPDHMIDIKHISELSYIKADKKDLKIGALTTHRTIEKSAAIEKSHPIICEMEHKLATVQTRNWGTIGGNLAHADPAGDPAPVLISLNATITLTSSKGERNIPLDSFYRDYFDADIEHGELLTEIQVPPIPANTGAAYTKFTIIENEMATVSAAVAITLASKDGPCEDVRIVLGNAAPIAKRAKEAEAVLKGKKITEALLKQAGEVAVGESEPLSDIHASEEYRKQLVRVLVKRVGAEALARAKK